MLSSGLPVIREQSWNSVLSLALPGATRYKRIVASRNYSDDFYSGSASKLK